MTHRALFTAALCLVALPAFARTPPAAATPAEPSWEEQIPAVQQQTGDPLSTADQIRENLARRAELDFATAVQAYASGLGAGALRRFRQSQYAWGASVGAQCAAEGDREEGSSLAQVLIKGCEVREAAARLTWLRAEAP